MKVSRIGSLLSFYLVLSLASLPVRAQELEGAFIPWGETKLYPSIGLSVGSNSNTFLTADNEISSSNFLVSPEIEWVADRRLLEIRGAYKGGYTLSSESVLSSADHGLSLDTSASLDKRKRIEGSLFFNTGHQTLGTGFTDDNNLIVREQTLTRDIGGLVRYVYGAKGAKGNIIVGLDLLDHAFTNQEELTSGRDYFRLQTNGVFSLRLSPDTRALIEGRFASYDYTSDIYDRTDTSALLGLTFNPTGKSGGSIKLGLTNNDFESTTFSNASFAIAELDLYYAIKPYSKLNIAIDRRFDSDNTSSLLTDAANAIRELASVQWQHFWNSKISSTVAASRLAIIRDCPGSNNETVSGTFEVVYRSRRWLEFGLGASTSNRSEITCDVESLAESKTTILQNGFTLRVKATL